VLSGYEVTKIICGIHKIVELRVLRKVSLESSLFVGAELKLENG
jgi:hypothetical protein